MKGVGNKMNGQYKLKNKNGKSKTLNSRNLSLWELDQMMNPIANEGELLFLNEKEKELWK